MKHQTLPPATHNDPDQKILLVLDEARANLADPGGFTNQEQYRAVTDQRNHSKVNSPTVTCNLKQNLGIK